MIKSFACAETENIWLGLASETIPLDIQRIARRKLRIPNNAASQHDLSAPVAGHLEYVKGTNNEYHIHIKGPWQLCFSWKQEAAYDVKIVDYQLRMYNEFTQYSPR